MVSKDWRRKEAGGPENFLKAMKKSMSLFCGGFSNLIELHNKKGCVS